MSGPPHPPPHPPRPSFLQPSPRRNVRVEAISLRPLKQKKGNNNSNNNNNRNQSPPIHSSPRQYLQPIHGASPPSSSYAAAVRDGGFVATKAEGNVLATFPLPPTAASARKASPRSGLIAVSPREFAVHQQMATTTAATAPLGGGIGIGIGSSDLETEKNNNKRKAGMTTAASTTILQHHHHHSHTRPPPPPHLHKLSEDIQNLLNSPQGSASMRQQGVLKELLQPSEPPETRKNWWTWKGNEDMDSLRNEVWLENWTNNFRQAREKHLMFWGGGGVMGGAGGGVGAATAATGLGGVGGASISTKDDNTIAAASTIASPLTATSSTAAATNENANKSSSDKPPFVPTGVGAARKLIWDMQAPPQHILSSSRRGAAGVGGASIFESDVLMTEWMLREALQPVQYIDRSRILMYQIAVCVTLLDNLLPTLPALIPIKHHIYQAIFEDYTRTANTPHCFSARVYVQEWADLLKQSTGATSDMTYAIALVQTAVKGKFGSDSREHTPVSKKRQKAVRRMRNFFTGWRNVYAFEGKARIHLKRIRSEIQRSFLLIILSDWNLKTRRSLRRRTLERISNECNALQWDRQFQTFKRGNGETSLAAAQKEVERFEDLIKKARQENFELRGIKELPDGTLVSKLGEQDPEHQMRVKLTKLTEILSKSALNILRRNTLGVGDQAIPTPPDPFLIFHPQGHMALLRGEAFDDDIVPRVDELPPQSETPASSIAMMGYEFTSFTDMVFNIEDEPEETAGLEEEDENTNYEEAANKHCEDAIQHAMKNPEKVVWKWTNHHLEAASTGSIPPSTRILQVQSTAELRNAEAYIKLASVIAPTVDAPMIIEAMAIDNAPSSLQENAKREKKERKKKKHGKKEKKGDKESKRLMVDIDEEEENFTGGEGEAEGVESDGSRPNTSGLTEEEQKIKTNFALTLDSPMMLTPLGDSFRGSTPLLRTSLPRAEMSLHLFSPDSVFTNFLSDHMIIEGSMLNLGFLANLFVTLPTIPYSSPLLHDAQVSLEEVMRGCRAVVELISLQILSLADGGNQMMRSEQQLHSHRLRSAIEELSAALTTQRHTITLGTDCVNYCDQSYHIISGRTMSHVYTLFEKIWREKEEERAAERAMGSPMKGKLRSKAKVIGKVAGRLKKK